VDQNKSCKLEVQENCMKVNVRELEGLNLT